MDFLSLYLLWTIFLSTKLHQEFNQGKFWSGSSHLEVITVFKIVSPTPQMSCFQIAYMTNNLVSLAPLTHLGK